MRVLRLVFLLALFAAISAGAQPWNVEAAIKLRLQSCLSLANVLRDAIDAAYARGVDLGDMPAEPRALRLAEPEHYANTLVASARYDRDGRVTITFRDTAELGEAAGRNMVFTPTPAAIGRKLRWRISEDSTVPHHLLPLHVDVSGLPIFRPLNASTPELEAIRLWHNAILNDDYVTYRSLAVILDRTSEPEHKAFFGELRRSVPTEFKISHPDVLPAGGAAFQVLGCKDGWRRSALMRVVPQATTYRIFSTLWSVPPNRTARECPV